MRLAKVDLVLISRLHTIVLYLLNEEVCAIKQGAFCDKSAFRMPCRLDKARMGIRIA